ncbi:hypothetical protein BGZ73_003678 [Actinomortierella ambigua]|nr:hypothetical protein BGZ73_003678 [Actinomortierella ambigua]
MAHPPILPLPSGDSRSAGTGWSLNSPRTQRILFNAFVFALVMYLLTSVVTINMDAEFDEDGVLVPQEQQRTNWNPRPNQQPNGQLPPPAGPNGVLYPGTKNKPEEGQSQKQQEQLQQGHGGALEQNTPEKDEDEEYEGSDDQDETVTPSGSQKQSSASHVLQSSTQLPPRLYDVILFNDELDLLEIRLHELNNVVDVFVIIESEESFQRHPKPVHFRLHERDPRFQPFKDRILHIVVPPMTDADLERARQVGGRGWEAETYLRSKGLFMALDIFRPSAGDWIMHSDVDEIPRSKILEQLKVDPSSLHIVTNNNNNPSPLTFLRLECDLYYYSFEFQRARGWVGPALARFEEPSSADVNVYTDDDETSVDANGRRILAKAFWDDWWNAGYRLRMRTRTNPAVPAVRDGCWHCSWCFETTSAYRNKAKSYSHGEHGQDVFMQEQWIVQHVREGKDLFDRVEQKYDYVVNNEDLPEYINIHRDRFAYLLDRKGKPNAGFSDVDENAVNY